MIIEYLLILFRTLISLSSFAIFSVKRLCFFWQIYSSFDKFILFECYCEWDWFLYVDPIFCDLEN